MVQGFQPSLPAIVEIELNHLLPCFGRGDRETCRQGIPLELRAEKIAGDNPIAKSHAALTCGYGILCYAPRRPRAPGRAS